MIGLEYICNLFNVQYKDIAERLGISKQTVNSWTSKRRPIPKKHLLELTKMFNIPEEVFQKEITEEDKIEIQKLKIRNDIKSNREEIIKEQHAKKSVKSFDEMTEDELVEAMEQEQQEWIQKLYNALDNLEGKSVLADTTGGFSTFQYYEWFSWSLFKTGKGTLKITLENDLDYDAETPHITFSVDEINIDNLIIDDNLNENGELDEYEKEYYVENIIIELKNGDKLKLELQW